MQRHCWNFDEPQIQCELDPEPGKVFCYACAPRYGQISEISDTVDNLIDNTD